MTWYWWALLVAMMVACPIVAGVALERATRERKTDDLAAAVAELEREIGAAFEPILRRVARELARWDRSER